MFVSLANIDISKNVDIKTEIASENIDKGKSILGAPPKLKRMRLGTLELRKTIIKSLNKRSYIFVITVKLQSTLIQIAISG